MELPNIQYWALPVLLFQQHMLFLKEEWKTWQGVCKTIQQAVTRENLS